MLVLPLFLILTESVAVNSHADLRDRRGIHDLLRSIPVGNSFFISVNNLKNHAVKFLEKK